MKFFITKAHVRYQNSQINFKDKSAGKYTNFYKHVSIFYYRAIKLYPLDYQTSTFHNILYCLVHCLCHPVSPVSFRKCFVLFCFFPPFFNSIFVFGSVPRTIANAQYLRCALSQICKTICVLGWKRSSAVFWLPST